MLERMVPASVNRTCRVMKACLNLAATLDGRIDNQDAWKRGLAWIPDAEESRNVARGSCACFPHAGSNDRPRLNTNGTSSGSGGARPLPRSYCIET
jgi:hypothetical protein